MKRVIDGKVYNTDTATKIGNYSNGYSCNDFNYLDQTLYLSKKGQFFLVGYGGANTIYAESYGDMRGEGSTLRLWNKQEALSWASQHLDTEVIEKYFTIEEG